jgi:hypothetical protein
MQEKSLLFEEDWAVVESLLPEGWRDKCKELGAYQRVRRFTGAGGLLRTLLIHVAQGCSFRETAVRAGEGGLASVTDVALNKRLRLSSSWLQWLAAGVAGKWLRREVPQDLDGPLRVKVADGSTVQEPGAKGASWRIHYSLELSSLQCDEVKITDIQGAESFKQFTIQPGDLWLGDRRYAQRSGIHHVVSQGGDVLLRIGVNSMILQDQQGSRFDLLQHLRSLKRYQIEDWPVFIPYNDDVIVGRICAVRKSESAIRREQKRILKENSKKGRKTRPETLEAAQYTVIFTTLDSIISPEKILNIYAARWQVELAFKRLKSLLGIGHLHNKNPDSAKAWLYGKLLTACLLEALAAVAEKFFPWGYTILQAQEMAQYLEGNGAHAPLLSTSSQPH